VHPVFTDWAPEAKETIMQLSNKPTARSQDQKWCIPPLLRRLCATVGGKAEAAFEETQPRLNEIMLADSLTSGESLGYHAVIRHVVSGERCELFLVADEVRSFQRIARVPRRTTLARDPGFALQMTASADLLRDLHCAHMVKIIANGLTNESKPRPYVITERLAGRNLAVYLRRHGSLDESLAVEVGAQVAKALSVLHRAGLTNPELHPSSVMLAHIAGDHFAIKLTGIERVRRMKSAPVGITNPDVRDDLHGLGQLLVHLLTGTPVAKVMSRRDPLAEVECEVMPDLATLLRRLRSRDPRDLPTSIEEVLQALRSIQASLAEASCVSMLRRPIAAMTKPQGSQKDATATRFTTDACDRDELSFGELSLLMPSLRPLSPLTTSRIPRGVRVAASLLMACLVCALGVAATLTWPGRADASVIVATDDDPEQVQFAQRSTPVVPYVRKPVESATSIDSQEEEVVKNGDEDQRAAKRPRKTTRREVYTPAELPSVEDMDDTDDTVDTALVADEPENDEVEAIPEFIAFQDSLAPEDDMIVNEESPDLLPLDGDDNKPSRDDLR